MAEPDIIKRLRRTILETAHRAKEGHVPSALSILDIVWCLYDACLGPDDRFVLSKGHGCLALYAVLAEKGIIPRDWLDHFCAPRSALQGHPERGTPGVVCSTGSLGHGLPMAVGMAYAKKILGEPGTVFCLIGDGEAQEGSVFEAMRLTDELGLNNLSVIVDMNEPERARHARRLSAFVDFVWEISDGHDHDAIRNGLKLPLRLIFAQTEKGHGIAEMAADPRAWHHRTMGLNDLMEVA